MEESLQNYKQWIELVGFAVDGMGVLLIAIGSCVATFHFLKTFPSQFFRDNFLDYKHNLSRVILLGLEFLVAGDIIRTVAVSPTYQSVGILSIIIVIRSLLSLEMQLELEGSFPWQKKKIERVDHSL